MTNIKLTALLIILSLLASCSEETIINYIDSPVPERTQGVIKVKAEDYTPEVSMLMLQDGESEDILFDANQRSFRVNAPLQCLSTKNRNSSSAFSAPARLRI
jgi:hypothetical protein